MSIRLSCPSCNHPFALAALPEHRRGTCPRCGDVFPIRTFTEESDAGVQEAPRPAPARGPGRFWGGGAFYLLLGAIGLAVVAAGIVAVANRKDKNSPDGPPVVAGAPANRLPGLSYLRPDTNVAFAVRLDPVREYAGRTGQPPGEVLKQTGLPDLLRGPVEQFGVPPEHIDHVVGGLTLGEGEETLRLALVMVLKEALPDEDAFLKGLKARPAAGRRPRHDVVVGRFPLLLERASPTVWVFGLDERDLAAVETGGHELPGSQFRGTEKEAESGLRSRLAGVPPEAAVWVAADDERDWAAKPLLKLGANVPELKGLLGAAKAGRGGLLAVTLGDQPRLRLDVRAADSAAGARARAYFAARAAEVPGGAASGASDFARFEAPFDPGTAKLLRQFLADAAR